MARSEITIDLVPLRPVTLHGRLECNGEAVRLTNVLVERRNDVICVFDDDITRDILRKCEKFRGNARLFYFVIRISITDHVNLSLKIKLLYLSHLSSLM